MKWASYAQQNLNSHIFRKTKCTSCTQSKRTTKCNTSIPLEIWYKWIYVTGKQSLQNNCIESVKIVI